MTGVDSFRQLTAKKRRMIEMRYNGASNADIATATGYSQTRIDHLFQRDTPLYAAYREYAEQMSDLTVTEARQMIRTYGLKAVETLEELSNEPHPAYIRVSAAKALAHTLLRAPELAREKPKQSEASRLLEQDLENSIISALRSPDT